MPPLSATNSTAIFGPYTVDLRSGELRKFGLRLKLGEQPFQVLLMLLEHRGQLVTREELRARLWGNRTFVDFDHSLNSAVQRLRECLSDSASHARWIETVPRRGYRFLAAVEWRERHEVPELPALPISKPPRAMPAVTDRTTRLRRQWVAVSLSLLLLAVLALQYRAHSSERTMPIRSVAVLPLDNLSGDPAQDYLADGMTNDLTTILAKDASFRIVSRTSVMRYKGVHRPIRDIAQELGVDAIVEGSVVRSGNDLRVTARLIHGPSDTHLWAESYDRDINQAVSLLQEMARNIAAHVNATDSPNVRGVSDAPGKR